MPTVAITLDPSCCSCRSKIQKILCCIQERCGFVFEKVVYEKEKVLVTGPFDAIDLCCKLRCEGGCFITKIEIVSPPPPPPTDKCKLIPYPYPYPCPYPYPQPACPSSCPTPPRPCQCHSCKPPPPPPCPPPRPVCPLPPVCCPVPPPAPCPAPRPVCPPPPVCCPVPPPPCPCPPWMPYQCRGYKRDFCCEDAQPDGPCAVM